MLKINLPKDEYEFQLMMETVDEFLREQKTRPHARPIKGWFLISSTLNLGLRMPRIDESTPRNNCYSGIDLSIRIFNWFDKRYGEKLKIYYGYGRIFIVLRDDSWIMEFPKVFGTALFFVSKYEKSTKPEEYLKKREIPRFNILDSLINFPEGLKESLSNDEMKMIFQLFKTGYKSMELIYNLRESIMLKEAKGDIESSIDRATSQSPNYGLSKWSSLQASEKILKIYLNNKGCEFPKSHNLEKLSELAKKKGLNNLINMKWIENTQCSAGVRYGEIKVTLQEAFDAHISSILICGSVAQHLI